VRTAGDMDSSFVVAKVFLDSDCGSALTNGVEDDEGSAGSVKDRSYSRGGKRGKNSGLHQR
jgi:hypothetical protein